MSYFIPTDVLKALEELLKTETNYDVIIHVGKESDTKEFHAHSGFLCCSSNYFNSIISANDTIKKDGKYIINMPNITPQIFDVIITYFYTGHIDMTNKTGIEILNIMIAFDDLELYKLIKLAEDHLIEYHRDFLQNDPIEFLQMICSHEIFNNIQELCLKNIYTDPNILFNSVEFINLPAPLLEIILKQDDLILNEIDEIEIWENLIKWGLAKDEILDEDVSTWNQEKFDIFEKILHKFIPLIRFRDISSEDYFNKVRPYEQILSRESLDDIMRFHMVRGSESSLTKGQGRLKRNIDSSLITTVKVDSLFINKEHIVLFANWIERTDNIKYNNNILYEFDLILRGSRDGFDSKTFHNKCDNKGATITVIKIKNSNQIVGGYNPLDWRSSFVWGQSTSSTPDSFLFSFNDNRNVGPGIISRPININGAVISDPNYGPVFGIWSNNSYDLCMKNGQCSSYPNSYTKINIPNNFYIDDYEVFQVKKKVYSKL